MKVNKNRVYKTVDGQDVIIYTTEATDTEFPVHGYIVNEHARYPILESWTIEGKFFVGSSAGDIACNLVEVFQKNGLPLGAPEPPVKEGYRWEPRGYAWQSKDKPYNAIFCTGTETPSGGWAFGNDQFITNSTGSESNFYIEYIKIEEVCPPEYEGYEVVFVGTAEEVKERYTPEQYKDLYYRTEEFWPEHFEFTCPVQSPTLKRSFNKETKYAIYGSIAKELTMADLERDYGCKIKIIK